MSVHRKIEKFLRATDMPPTKFGRLAVRDPRFVLDLRRGREPGPRIVARVEAFLAAQQPVQPPQRETGQ
ncbi:hypothetical protein JMG10_33380 [Nostoc ellipsosporum NOK]|uniref:hypothetical protein n=1 Tax=Sphingomonas sp. IBVSS2 TaxID=1985172 RepID=UPI000A2D42B1|nr:hypothetical protein [Sphingomonas sp. IBVSS2]MDF2386406.1 hypothetical protein [Nostoc ellipsosporum NOK]OSZ63122.1 hypothetical protein CAP40_18920 [Sphingomonas sp. IBVSS2]